MRQRITRGKHRGGSWLDRFPWIGSDTWTRTIIFTAQSRYHLDGQNQKDANKIGGRCYGFSGSHGTSVRIGWSYNEDTDDFDLVAYCYVRGRRQWKKTQWPSLGSVPLDTPVTLTIEVFKEQFVLTARVKGCAARVALIGHDLKPWERTFGLGRGAYFGGDDSAPHDVSYQVEYRSGEWLANLLRVR